MSTIQRFRITYRDGAYKVSIPDYDGGEVVRAEHYDAETGRLLRTLELIAKLYQSTRPTPTELNKALFQASESAKAVLEHWQ